MNWIDINKQKPEPYSKFLVFVSANNISDVHMAFYGNKGIEVLDEYGNHTEFITHWMHTPDAP